MSELLKTILPPLVAAISAIAVAYLGYLWSKKNSKNNRRTRYAEEKYEAYKEVWKMLEEKHIAMRTRDLNQSDYEDMEREINAELLNHSLHLDDEDRSLFQRYLGILQSLSGSVAQVGSEADKEDWDKTRELAPEQYELIKLMNEEESAMNEIRNKFKQIL